MVTYIKSTIPHKFVEFENKLDENLYNNLGTTYQDYLKGKWVLLSDEQVNFRNENPDASVKEVFDMKLKDSVKKNIISYRNDVMKSALEYKNSTIVKSFHFQEKEYWMDSELRNKILTKLNAEKSLDVIETIIWLGDDRYVLGVDEAIDMVNKIELYSAKCYDNYQEHIRTISLLTNVEDVKNYNFTTGYPDKLFF